MNVMKAGTQIFSEIFAAPTGQDAEDLFAFALDAINRRRKADKERLNSGTANAPVAAEGKRRGRPKKEVATGTVETTSTPEAEMADAPAA